MSLSVNPVVRTAIYSPLEPSPPDAPQPQSPAPEGSHPPERRLSLAGRIGTALGIVIPLAGVVAAGALTWGWGFNWVDLGLLVGMYFITLAGVTVGFHRLFVHRSYETVAPIKFVLAVMGMMAVQGNIFKWVALHRKHHQHSDTADDVHSPHYAEHGPLGFISGLWHSHIGWAFKPDPENLARYVKDLNRSPSLRFANSLFEFWVIAGMVLPALVGWALTGGWAGALTGFIWGGLVRVFLVHHVTWSINSACHLWGRKPFKSDDESRNNFVFGVLALGEGWHNTHHAFPTSVRHGLKWWELDLSYWMIRALAAVGLAWNLRLPSAEALEQRAA